jgi:hypothetical protein
MRLSGHGIEIDLPRGWDGRIFRRQGGDATLHAGNFPLPTSDGDFGSGATARMPHGGALLVVKEYRAGPRLTPGTGLFASRSIPLPLHAGHFHPRSLQVGRPGQAGFQHFFTIAGRPFCIYAVVKAAPAGSTIASGAHGQVAQLSHLASSLRFHRLG